MHRMASIRSAASGKASRSLVIQADAEALRRSFDAEAHPSRPRALLALNLSLPVAG
jgi:hypothetical protein